MEFVVDVLSEDEEQSSVDEQSTMWWYASGNHLEKIFTYRC